MPYVDKQKGLYLSPEAAAERGLCPECGLPLSETTAELEKIKHWPRGLSMHQDQTEAEKHAAEIQHRMKLIDDYYNPPKVLTAQERLAEAKANYEAAVKYAEEHS